MLDSGATHHLTPHRELLHNYVEDSVELQFGDGDAATSHGSGEVLVHTEHGDFHLQRVLYVPTAVASLLAVSCAVDRGVQVDFKPDECCLSFHGVRFAVARRVGGLYIIGPPGACVDAHGLLAVAPQSAQLWHKRFGHLGHDSLAQMQERGLVKGISVPSSDFRSAAREVCESCALAKHHRFPFPSSGRRSTALLQLVHMDLCGPLQEPSLGGAKYLANFLEDFSRLSVVRPVRNKSDVPALVCEVLALMESQSNHRLRAIRTDRGSEYINAVVHDFLRIRGAVHQTTAPYTPQQNGAAERLNRTLMERVRAMLYCARLPHELWAEAAQTANYLRNRSPAAGQGKTPWELFYGSTPSVAHLLMEPVTVSSVFLDAAMHVLSCMDHGGVKVHVLMYPGTLECVPGRMLIF